MASSKSSFTVFNAVDESVAKPVLGSDGAARWQDFKTGSKLPITTSVAPALPLKKIDRALGTKSIRDEQANEAKIRRDAGDREAGAGYTVFKRKSDHEEIAAEKKRKLVLDRVRPDDTPYYLPAETFEGYKFDYVFTTKETRGTGYYWDGTDSLKRELGQAPTYSANVDEADAAAKEAPTKTKKKKKKKKIREVSAVPENDEFNPMEQIAQAILRRNKLAIDAPPSRSLGFTEAKADAVALGADSSVLNMASPSVTETLEPELAAAGWESAKDPNSGKVYYFRRSTNERSWSKPPHIPMKTPEENDKQLLSDGWKSTKDPNSGKVYYYHTSGKTSWENPLS
mmetsp:Transcript_21200/g.45305  ORF Transcript_21200/g.45305 Transcript_21200/m.45305 type:complete len:341 (-) Transcript_21200:117-1139(-)|eukprot:CAMPEP_0172534616 /NCGR_PEP_ID=MMETSP1067-20121228/6915_1 /TAXON_ID=265564 ORGANISM="Thalassiosira punctigera, Strain Tpunct2005C2" /NCGR_SAMPLE_ID=MMETSP1067 /ASSEMBLY_ACC=CAM_ASM_000444 /LENGTH=340 /DNA_ID=CAMNT_0013319429 /DNA_START=23 /DNA_END=1045 /DNA_ORIENTATION=-